MQILVIADRPPDSSLSELCDQHTVDLICTLGDLDVFSLGELSSITHIPKIGVYGNHCSGNYFDSLGIHNMHLDTYTHQGVTFGGFEGSVRYKDNPDAIMYTQQEAAELLADFPPVDVMVTHAPPYGVNDEPDEKAHQGFKALRTYLEVHKPAYLLHGHTYPTEETVQTKYADTTIRYVFKEETIPLPLSAAPEK